MNYLKTKREHGRRHKIIVGEFHLENENEYLLWKTILFVYFSLEFNMIKFV